ncbi:MAG TPA: protoporphyrinogen oxidase [Actinomycetales bacterium]|nr:protoporphyrinogen oxidase [Actinomycetales bacterium]
MSQRTSASSSQVRRTGEGTGGEGTGPDVVPTVVVVGAGIAGLAAAWALATSDRDLHVVVLEGATRVGGKLALDELDGVVVDVGAESLLARRPEAVELAREVGLGGELEPPQPVGASIWSRGALRPLPPHTLMGVPSGAEGLDGLLTADEVGTVLKEPDRTWPEVDSDVDVASFVASRVGHAVVDRLVEPLLGGVYAGRADQLSLQATMPPVWAAAVQGRSLVSTAAAAGRPTEPTTSAPAPVFAGVRGGVGRLPLALADVLRDRSVSVLTGAMVRRLERTATGWRVGHGPAVAEEVVEADGVVLAVPAAPTSRLLSSVAPSAAAVLADIPYASMGIVTLVLPASDEAGQVSGSGFLVPPVEGLRVKAATFSSLKWGWLSRSATGRLVLRASIGRYGQEDELQHPDGDLVRAVAADLGTVLGPLPAPLASAVTRWGGGLPQYTVGHVDRVSSVRREVARLPGLALCGAAYDGVGVPACIASGRAAAHDVLVGLDRARSARP